MGKKIIKTGKFVSKNFIYIYRKNDDKQNQMLERG